MNNDQILHVPTILRCILAISEISHLHALGLVEVFLRDGVDVWEVCKQLFTLGVILEIEVEEAG